MSENPMRLDRLEPRLLLSGVDLAETVWPSPPPTYGTTEIIMPLDELTSTTTVTLLTGELLTLGISPEDLAGQADLAGISFELDAVGDRGLEVSGLITSGLFSRGLIDIVGVGNLEAELERSRDLFFARATEGAALTVKIEQSAFQWAALDLTILADIQIGDQQLTLEGSVDGKLDGSRKLDVDGAVTLREDFPFAQGPMAATLKAGQSVVADIKAGELLALDFGGVLVETDIDIEGKNLALTGQISAGKYADGKIDFYGELSLRQSFTYESDEIRASLQSGATAGLKVENSQFKFAELSGLGEVDITIPDSGDLKLAGKIEGKYDVGEGLDLEGSVILLDPFVHKIGKVIETTVRPGATAGFKVENSQFQFAEFAGLADVDVTVPETTGLKLEGKIAGKYDAGEGLDLGGGLALGDPFIYEKGPVTARLRSGGSAEIKVERSEFKFAEFSAEGEVDVAIPETTGLKLEGKIAGKYDAGEGLDLGGSLALGDPFIYEKGPVTARLQSGGSAEIKVESSEFKFAEFSSLAAVDVSVPYTNGLKLAGTLTGKYENGLLDLDGGLSIRDDFVYTRGRVMLTVLSDQAVTFDTHAGEFLEIDLSGAAVEVDISRGRRGRTLELAGSVYDGGIIDGRFDIDANLDLRSPLVLMKRPVTIMMVSAKAFLSIDDGEADRFRLRRPVLRVLPPPWSGWRGGGGVFGPSHRASGSFSGRGRG